ncbi:expressed unknown protein [Seminavis robusta]|uniref:Uncharacterized protein n=1 Tax=Seminavis robusta TaxID=568900 RepID=A0A9N8DB53_9STRA|nr:expressed unknown protein [Seminavis robusta]|eukprot:Sro21_g014660.1 n/a (335) ;mRNA; f:72900-74014
MTLPKASSSTILQRVTSLLLLLSSSIRTASATRVLAFKWLEGSGTCYNKFHNGNEKWDIEMNNFHVDCGNRNHGCTPGHSVMIYGDFYSNAAFESVVDVDIKACEFGSLICTPNFVETQMNVCYDLDLLDLYGNEVCNQVGNYTLQKSYTLPSNHSWWEDVAFEGLKFNIVVLIDNELECRGTFMTRVYYEYESWMGWTVGSFAVAAALFYYLRQTKQGLEYFNRNFTCLGKINLQVEEERAEEEARAAVASQTKKKIISKTTPVTVKSSTSTADDEESVTSTAYLRMLDFSPKGLAHTERMEQVRQAHFERLRKIRDSRRAASSSPPLVVPQS